MFQAGGAIGANPVSFTIDGHPMDRHRRRPRPLGFKPVESRLENHAICGLLRWAVLELDHQEACRGSSWRGHLPFRFAIKPRYFSAVKRLCGLAGYFDIQMGAIFHDQQSSRS